MSDYPIPKRIMVARPRWRTFRNAKWIVRPVPDMDESDDRNLVINQTYRIHCGLHTDSAHETLEVYYHSSVVEELKEKFGLRGDHEGS